MRVIQFIDISGYDYVMLMVIWSTKKKRQNMNTIRTVLISFLYELEGY